MIAEAEHYVAGAGARIGADPATVASARRALGRSCLVNVARSTALAQCCSWRPRSRR